MGYLFHECNPNSLVLDGGTVPEYRFVIGDFL